jgi:Ca-activated chloride channel family protein
VKRSRGGASPFLLGFLLACSPVLMAAQSTPANSEPAEANVPVLRVNVKLVNVFANVTDATGAIVGGLSKEDFAITEDGRAQRIAVFERQ